MLLLENKTVGFAVCGSFCTHAKAMEALEQVKARFARVVPIVSEVVSDRSEEHTSELQSQR